MIGHAVAGLPGASFVMPEPSAAAVTGYGGAGGLIASGAGTDATNGTPNVAAATVSETALATIAPMADPRLAGAPFDTTTTVTPGGGGGKVGAPMCPEHSDGLGDVEPAPRKVAASETRLGRLKRMLLYSGTRSAPVASNDEDGTGRMQTEDGRLQTFHPLANVT